MPVIPKAISALKAERLEVSRIATGSIALYDPVYLVSPTNVSTADVDTLVKATVFGIALNAALDTESVTVLMMGNIEDASFVFALNVGLFQSILGPISDNATINSGEFFCRIGKSNGAGSIFINPEIPVEVT